MAEEQGDKGIGDEGKLDGLDAKAVVGRRVEPFAFYDPESRIRPCSECGKKTAFSKPSWALLDKGVPALCDVCFLLTDDGTTELKITNATFQRVQELVGRKIDRAEFERKMHEWRKQQRRG